MTISSTTANTNIVAFLGHSPEIRFLFETMLLDAAESVKLCWLHQPESLLPPGITLPGEMEFDAHSVLIVGPVLHEQEYDTFSEWLMSNRTVLVTAAALQKLVAQAASHSKANSLLQQLEESGRVGILSPEILSARFQNLLTLRDRVCASEELRELSWRHWEESQLTNADNNNPTAEQLSEAFAQLVLLLPVTTTLQLDCLHHLPARTTSPEHATSLGHSLWKITGTTDREALVYAVLDLNTDAIVIDQPGWTLRFSDSVFHHQHYVQRLETGEIDDDPQVSTDVAATPVPTLTDAIFTLGNQLHQEPTAKANGSRVLMLLTLLKQSQQHLPA